MIEQIDETDIEKSTFEKELTKEEVAMFERLRAMEAVHNELAFGLSAFKESIITTRNQFVQGVTKKYGIGKPSLVTYDPIKQRLVSVFHPELKGHKIIQRPNALRKIASDLMKDAVKQLSEAFRSL